MNNKAYVNKPVVGVSCSICLFQLIKRKGILSFFSIYFEWILEHLKNLIFQTWNFFFACGAHIRKPGALRWCVEINTVLSDSERKMYYCQVQHLLYKYWYQYLTWYLPCTRTQYRILWFEKCTWYLVLLLPVQQVLYKYLYPTVVMRTSTVY